jgi:hypothetical protein
MNGCLKSAGEGISNGRQPAQKGAVPRRIGRTKGGLNSKLHPVCDGLGRPLIMLLREGQMSGYKGAALMIDAFPKAAALPGPASSTWLSSSTPMSENLTMSRTKMSRRVPQ